MSEQRKAVALLVLTAVLWSTSGLFIKLIAWTPLGIAGVRSAIAALVLLCVVRRRNFTWSAAQLGGAVAFAATVILFVVATKSTTAANAILLQYTSPLWIALFAPWFLGERAHWFDWLLIALILSGMWLFFLDDLTVAARWGNIVAIITSVTFAWFTLFLRKQKAGSPVESIFLGNVLAAAVCLPFMFDGGPPAGDWIWLGALGVLQLGLPGILYAVAVRKVTALEAMLIPAIEPVLNPILVMAFQGERPGAWALVGGALVLGAVVVRAALTARGDRRLV